jgi:outer membrane assembly lipoprotein YfgL
MLAACANVEKPPPTPLEEIAPKIAGREAWHVRIGAFGPTMVPAVHDETFIVATADGQLRAVHADSGTTVWQAQVGAPVSAGVGSDGRFTSIVTRTNEVVTFEAGRELWRKRVPSSVVTPPLVAGERVFVMGVDRAVHAFDALDGRRLWSLQRPGDALTLAQTGVLAAFRNTLLAGQGARLAALDPLRGTVQWEVPMASPRGTNEVERLADLVGPTVRVGERVCARAFQSAVACADAARGAVLWSRTVGGVNAVSGDAERVFGADASDRITAWRADTGDVVWSQEKMLYRGLSGALAVGPLLVFGDAQGWVHFLSTSTGEKQLHLPTDGTPVMGVPRLAGKTLLVTTQGGGLYAFRPQ